MGLTLRASSKSAIGEMPSTSRVNGHGLPGSDSVSGPDEVVISLFLLSPRLTTLPPALFHDAESRVDPLLDALAEVLVAFALMIVLVVDRLAGFTRAAD